MSRYLFTKGRPRSLLFPIFFFSLINLIVFTLSRLGLSLWQQERVSAVNGWGELFLQGLRMDVVLFIRGAGIIDCVAISSKRVRSHLAAYFAFLVDGRQCVYRVYGTGDTGIY